MTQTLSLIALCAVQVVTFAGCAYCALIVAMVLGRFLLLVQAAAMAGAR